MTVLIGIRKVRQRTGRHFVMVGEMMIMTESVEAEGVVSCIGLTCRYSLWFLFTTN